MWNNGLHNKQRVPWWESRRGISIDRGSKSIFWAEWKKVTVQEKVSYFFQWFNFLFKTALKFQALTSTSPVKRASCVYKSVQTLKSGAGVGEELLNINQFLRRQILWKVSNHEEWLLLFRPLLRGGNYILNWVFFCSVNFGRSIYSS